MATKATARRKPRHVRPARSAERSRLAEAIAEHDDAARRLIAIASALEAASKAVYAASSAAEDAPALIEKAKVDAAEHLTEVALGNAGRPPVSVRQARARVQEAEDNLAAARASRDALERKHREAESGLTVLSLRLDNAIADVVRSEGVIGNLATDYKVLRRELASYANALGFLHRSGCLPPELQFWDSEPNDISGALVEQLKAALAALRNDADATLPTI